MIRPFIGTVVGAAAVIFALQNTGSASYVFPAWEITAPRVLMLLIIYPLGVLTGWLVAGVNRFSRRRR